MDVMSSWPDHRLVNIMSLDTMLTRPKRAHPDTGRTPHAPGHRGQAPGEGSSLSRGGEAGARGRVASPSHRPPPRRPRRGGRRGSPHSHRDVGEAAGHRTPRTPGDRGQRARRGSAVSPGGGGPGARGREALTPGHHGQEKTRQHREKEGARVQSDRLWL